MSSSTTTGADVVENDVEELTRHVDPSTLQKKPSKRQLRDRAKASVGSSYTGFIHTSGRTNHYSGASTLQLNRGKLAYQARKVTDTVPYVAHPNLLYPTLKSPRFKTEFAFIAQNFQLLDEQLATYFKSTVLFKLTRKDIDHLLCEARATVRKAQHELDEHQEVILGDIGQFCEDITGKLLLQERLDFTPTDVSVDARLHYLQDAYLDVPYWRFILELFANEQSPAKERFIRVMSHVKLDSINRRAKLLENAKNWTETEKKDVKEMGPILHGIEARLECLDNVCHTHALDLELSPLLSKLLQSRSMSFYDAQVSLADKVMGQEDPVLADKIENDTASAGSSLAVIEMRDKSKEVSINLGLLAILVIPSFVLGAYAFSISMTSNEPGTFKDADFWNLLQSTVISSSGSLALAIGFFLHDRKKITHWSTAYTTACLIWVASLVCGIVSVAIYTRFNTAWSSIMSTLSGMLALVTPLLLIEASTLEAGSVKGVKKKQE